MKLSPARFTVTSEAAWLVDYLPLVLPFGWRLESTCVNGARFVGHGDPRRRLCVIVSARIENGQRWVHVSCSRPAELPSWDDFRQVKDLFIGRDVYAVQVLPPAKLYVNEHPYVLHLFHCVDGHPLPEFSALVDETTGRRSL